MLLILLEPGLGDTQLVSRVGGFSRHIEDSLHSVRMGQIARDVLYYSPELFGGEPVRFGRKGDLVEEGSKDLLFVHWILGYTEHLSSSIGKTVILGRNWKRVFGDSARALNQKVKI